MPYEKQTFVDDETVLSAEHLQHIEDGIVAAFEEITKLKNGVSRITTVRLLASAWVGEGSLHSQIVTIEGITANSQVDLTPNVTQLVAFYDKDLTFVTENEGGVVTVYVIGQKPTNDYTIQATITEVST